MGMALMWYLNRLRNMSMPEIAHRIAENSRKKVSRALHHGKQQDAPAMVDAFPGIADRLAGADGYQRQAIAEAVSRARAGEFEWRAGMRGIVASIGRRG